MKNQTYTPFIIAAMLMLSACRHDKEPVTNAPSTVAFMAPTAPMNRTVILEEFSGVRCWWTAQGHDSASAVLDANPDNSIVISIHTTGYSSPQTGWPNYTSKAGEAIGSQAYISAIPAGSFNRFPCKDLGVSPMTSSTNCIIAGRQAWRSAARKVTTMPAPVNLGAKATFDVATRILTVKVDLYYTADETLPNNLNICLLQDKLVGKQQLTYQGGADPNYVHNHVLRDMITPGNWGEVLKEETKLGSRISKTYTYKVPEFYNGSSADGGGAVVIDNLKVVAFVSHGQWEVLNALQVDVK